MGTLPECVSVHIQRPALLHINNRIPQTSKDVGSPGVTGNCELKVCGVPGTRSQSSIRSTDIRNGQAISTVPLEGSKDNPGREQSVRPNSRQGHGGNLSGDWEKPAAAGSWLLRTWDP